MWTSLFYDKYAGDHHFKNIHTKNITESDLNDGSYTIYYDKDALEMFKKKFSDFACYIPEDLSESPLYKVSLYSKKLEEKNIEAIYTLVEVSNQVLIEHIIEGKKIPHESFIRDLCRYHLQYTRNTKDQSNTFYSSKVKKDLIKGNTEFITEKSNIPLDYTFHTAVPKLDTINLDLYRYQRCSIHWMVNKERNMDIVPYNLHDEVVLGDCFYDMYDHKFELVKNRKQLKFHGGALIDEVGLGKTIQMISLSISNPAKDTSYTRPGVKDRLFSRATLVICPNQLCGQWKRELQSKLSKDYNAKILVILTKRHFEALTYQDLLDADFVIVSFTFFDNKAYTLKWSTKVSKIKSFSKKEWTTSDKIKVRTLFEEEGEKIVANPFETFVKDSPMLHLIHWHRLVIDEFHEVHASHERAGKYRGLANILPHFRSTFRWVVSATPFITKMVNIVDFLTNYTNEDGDEILKDGTVVDYLATKCFRRNTKKSVSVEYTLPPVKEVIRWLKFSATERMMYNAHLADPNNNKFGVYLRQLCCHPQLADATKHALSNCKTLADIEKMMVSHYKDEMDNAVIACDKLKERIKKSENKLHRVELRIKVRKLKKLKKMLGVKDDSDSDSDSEEEEIDEDQLNNDISTYYAQVLASGGEFKEEKSVSRTEIKENISKLEARLSEANDVLDGKTKTYNFFLTVLEKLKNATIKEDGEEDEDECAICMDDIPEDNVGVTQCGHIFCYECLKIWIKKAHNCPMCKRQLKDNEVYVLSYEKKKKMEHRDLDREELIDNIGTKLADLVYYLREQDTHTIIFSQWDDLLHKVGHILNENKIKNVFCKGNVFQRDKAIREFDRADGDIKVIMLSSEKAASGTNLTKASQIIFLDPIYGDYRYRKDQERQAVGRAHRMGQTKELTVVRFIIKGSVEEEIYHLNKVDDAKYKTDSPNVEEIEINV